MYLCEGWWLWKAKAILDEERLFMETKWFHYYLLQIEVVISTSNCILLAKQVRGILDSIIILSL